MDMLIYVANILYLISYMVRDIFHLRLLTIVAAFCLVTYFYNQPEPLMTVIYWNLFFVALNELHGFATEGIGRIVGHRNRVMVTINP